MDTPTSDSQKMECLSGTNAHNANCKIDTASLGASAASTKIDYAANTLAFVGDAVFTLFIRRRLATLNLKAGDLTRMAAKQVSATSQSAMLEKITDILTDSEKDIVRRCRNAHTNNRAKNASIVDYRRATGLEGLIGYLYLSGDDRLETVLNKCVENQPSPAKE